LLSLAVGYSWIKTHTNDDYDYDDLLPPKRRPADRHIKIDDTAAYTRTSHFKNALMLYVLNKFQ